MAGAPVAEDVSIPALARRAGELAKEHGCDVVVGFSHGATVALEMLLSGHFQGPVVLLGISLTSEDEAGFFRAVIRASQKVGSWPMAILLRLMPWLYGQYQSCVPPRCGLSHSRTGGREIASEGPSPTPEGHPLGRVASVAAASRHRQQESWDCGQHQGNDGR
jgi:hypothetical protein